MILLTRSLFYVNYVYNGLSLQNGRQSNMDSLLLKAGQIGGKKSILAVVCDGVGSMAHGAYASGAAAQMLGAWFEGAISYERIGLRLRDAVIEINARVMEESKLRNIDTASTLSALVAIENNYYIVHIGDSRIFSYRRGALALLTHDDVSESGKLRACIGKADNFFLHYSEGPASDTIFLLCTDGLYKRMDEGFLKARLDEWGKSARSEPMGALPEYVITRGEQDNITLALIKIEG